MSFNLGWQEKENECTPIFQRRKIVDRQHKIEQENCIGGRYNPYSKLKEQRKPLVGKEMKKKLSLSANDQNHKLLFMFCKKKLVLSLSFNLGWEE